MREAVVPRAAHVQRHDAAGDECNHPAAQSSTLYRGVAWHGYGYGYGYGLGVVPLVSRTWLHSVRLRYCGASGAEGGRETL